MSFLIEVLLVVLNCHGSGCGIVGLVLACLGAEVILTDLPMTMTLLSQNISYNEHLFVEGGGKAKAVPLDWTTNEARGMQKPDFIVAADVIYRRELMEPLLSCLLQLMGPSTELWLAHVRRWRSDMDFFKKLVKYCKVRTVYGRPSNEDDNIRKHPSRLPHLEKGKQQIFVVTMKDSYLTRNDT